MPSRGTAPVRVSAAHISSNSTAGGWMTFTATYYNNSYESTGKRPGDKGYGITSSGRPTSSLSIAVDPSIIPLGTMVEIKYPDGRIETRRADDTGGAIGGRKIDIFMNVSTKQLYQLGKHSVQLRILK